MSIDKNFDELERHLSWAQSYYEDLKSTVEDELKYLHDEIKELKEEKETLEEQNQLLEEQLTDLTVEKGYLELELIENTNELMKLRHELDISR